MTPIHADKMHFTSLKSPCKVTFVNRREAMTDYEYQQQLEEMEQQQ
jgi:hypothetical protein